MALYQIDAHGRPKRVTRFPYADAYRAVRRLLTGAEGDAIMLHLAQEVEVRPEILTTSWIPGADWTGTPLERIYEVCGDEVLAAKIFAYSCGTRCKAIPKRGGSATTSWTESRSRA